MYSVTRAFNAGREDIIEGLCCIEGQPQQTLKDAIHQDPVGMLGAQHVAQWGETLGVLIKLIDSAERLTVQVHPNKAMARRLFNSPFGKTECWHILGVREDAEQPPCLYLGFRPGITRALWEDCFHRQDYPAMLALMNRVEVKAGETYLVRGGLPHAIGANCFLTEIQEPTDFTIRVEKVTPTGFVIDDRMCHQGLGFDRMFECFDYTGRTEQELRSYCCIEPKTIAADQRQLVGYEDTECFAMKELTVDNAMDLSSGGEFSCLFIAEGEGQLVSDGQSQTVCAGDQFFIPAACGEYRIEAKSGRALRILQYFGPQLAANRDQS